MSRYRFSFFLIIHLISFGQIFGFVRQELSNLTSKEITEIIQDSKGFLWIGTDNGLNRFDGWSNVTFTHSREDTTSVKSNIIEALFNDSKGNLWIASGCGLQRYRPGSDQFENICFPNANTPSVRSVVQRADNELLVVTSGFGAFSVNTATMQASPMEALNKNIGTVYAHQIKIDPLNRIWIAAAEGRIISLDKNLNILHTSRFPEKAIDIAFDRNNNIFAATENAVYKWDGNRRAFEKLNGFDGWGITGLYTDSKGTIHVLTLECGVFKIEDGSFVYEDSFTEIKGLGILIMYEDRDGNFWIGTRKGGLETMFNSQEFFQFQDIPEPPSIKMETLFSRSAGSGVGVALSNGMITAFDSELRPEATFKSNGRVTSSYPLRDGSILLGYADGKIMNYSNGQLQMADQIGDNLISALAEDSSGRLYAAVNGHGFKYRNDSVVWISVAEETKMDSPAHLGNDWINVIIPLEHNKIILGHFNGIDIFDSSANKFLDDETIRSFRGQIVYSILKAKDKTLWIGTGDGLYHYFPEDGHKDFFGIKEGLTGNVICGIEQANNGDIWCTTNNGISRIRYNDKKIVNYISGNGLGEHVYRKGMLLRTAEDKLFAIGFNGITAFYPDAVTDSNFIAAPTLTRIYLNNKNEPNPAIAYSDSDKDVSATVYLKYYQNTFTLEFSTFDYMNPESISFEYRIPAMDKRWHTNPLGDNRIVCNYLAPGKYILEIRAIHNGQQSAVSSVLICILPPWYLTVWAKIGCLIIFAFVAFAIWHIFNRYRMQRRKDEIAEEKFKMLYNFAHELRSPATLITSPLTSLILEEKDEQRANTFRMIQRNGYRITNLVDNMLDMRRIEKGQLKLSFADTDLKEYIEYIIEDFRLQAQSRKVNLSFESPDGPVMAYIDPEHFDKVIVNLIGNALKFTPSGGSVEVVLKKNTGSDGHQQAVIEVADTGPGILTKDLGHIFERFYQSNRKNKGFGIGLHFTKMLVDIHHGTITASNRENHGGALFVVTVPLGKSHLKDTEISKAGSDYTPKRHIAADEIMAMPQETDSSKARRNFRVLVCDDDEEICSYLKTELGTAYKIVTASNGNEAYSIAQQRHIDLIISDIMMPESDGFELLKKIRGNFDLSHIPIILLTTSEDFKMKMSGWENGADGYITKPFRIEELRQLVANLISGRIKLKGHFSHGEKTEDKIKKVDIKGNDEILLEKITSAIDENLSDSEFGVEQLADAVGLSRVHLHRKMKILLGLTPRDFLKSVRLKRAAEMLLKKNTNISQIAYSVGFSSPGQFSESFKKYYGCSPSEYISRFSDSDASPDETESDPQN